MKRVIVLAFALLMISGVAYSQGVRKIVGANAYGPVPEGVRTISSLCTGATCPIFASPDYDDELTFVGGTASQCKKSTNGGSTWTNCGTNPPASPTYGSGSNLYGVAIPEPGVWVAAVSSSTTCQVSRSLDGGATWTQVLSETPQCALNSINLGTNLHCKAGTCILANGDASAPIRVRISTDSGATWSTAYTDAVNAATSNNFYYNWSTGAGFLPSLLSRSIYVLDGNISSGWIGSTVNLSGLSCRTGIENSTLGGVVFCGGATPRRWVNIATGTVTNVTLPDDGGTGAYHAINSSTTGFIYVVGPATTFSGCSGSITGVWVSADNGSTFHKSSCLSATAFLGGTLFEAHGKIYGAASNTAAFWVIE